MKTGFFIVLTCLLGYYANGESSIYLPNNLDDSLRLKALKIKQLYVLSTASSKDECYYYQLQFFDAFPDSFKQLNKLYADKDGPLSSVAHEHIYLFNGLNNINDTLYYKKIISIGIGGHWDADAIDFFQQGLRNKILGNPELTATILKNLSTKKILSFWRFYFDGPHPKKQLQEPLQRMKFINNKIYNLMVQAQTVVLKDWKE
ncbi:MAG TPA: hypothetical protein VIQ77_00980 [Mucilaginibacter sp.]|jgi:hypothetical protein